MLTNSTNKSIKTSLSVDLRVRRSRHYLVPKCCKHNPHRNICLNTFMIPFTYEFVFLVVAIIEIYTLYQMIMQYIDYSRIRFSNADDQTKLFQYGALI
jgi:hypothetical protein